MKIKGEPESKILKQVNALGYYRELKTKNPKMDPIQKMSATKLNNLFKDPIYYGILKQKHHGTEQEVDLRDLYNFKTVVTEEEWQAVQEKAKNYLKKDIKHSFPFKGLVICNACGTPRQAAASMGRSKNRFLYFRCDTLGCPEKGKSIRAKKIIEAINSVLEAGFDFSKPRFLRRSCTKTSRKLLKLNTSA